MRIAVCGPERSGLISKLEKELNVTAIKPWGDGSIMDYTAVTYTKFDQKNVLFDGSPFDFLYTSDSEEYNEVYEQLALISLVNIDKLVFVTNGMSESRLSMLKSYAELFPKKIFMYTTIEAENVNF